MFENFAVLITPSINRVVEFAKRIPGNETCLCYVIVNESVKIIVHMLSVLKQLQYVLPFFCGILTAATAIYPPLSTRCCCGE